MQISATDSLDLSLSPPPLSPRIARQARAVYVMARWLESSSRHSPALSGLHSGLKGTPRYGAPRNPPLAWPASPADPSTCRL